MRGFLLGGLLILAATIGAAVHATTGLTQVDERIAAFPKTSLAEGSVMLRAQSYDIYVDVPAATGDFRWELRVLDAGGRELEIAPPTSSVSYDGVGGRSGMLVGKVDVPAAGRHLVRGNGPPGARAVFGQGIFGTVGRTILVALLIFLGGAGAGVAVIVATAVRRRGPREPKLWP